MVWLRTVEMKEFSCHVSLGLNRATQYLRDGSCFSAIARPKSNILGDTIGKLYAARAVKVVTKKIK